MNYTLHQLRIFVEVVKELSVTEAAKKLNISQPALSIQLKNFQDQFDQPLTEIHSRRLHVTEFGYDIANIAENVLSEVELIHYKTKEYDGLISGKLKISSASTGKYVIPYFISKFHQLYPGIDLVLDVTNKTKVMEDLTKNLIDFALVSVVPEGVEVFEEKLLRNELYLVGNKPTFDENASLIYREEGSATRASMNEYFKDRKKRKVLELTSNETIKQAIIAGLGYSILPLIGVKNEIKNKQLYIIEREDLPIITQWRLIWLKNKKLSHAAEAYLDFLKTHKEEITVTEFKWYHKKLR